MADRAEATTYWYTYGDEPTGVVLQRGTDDEPRRKNPYVVDTTPANRSRSTIVNRPSSEPGSSGVQPGSARR